MQYRFLKLVLGACLLVMSFSLLAQNTNTFAGNWILDVEESVFESGLAPQRQTRAYQIRPGDTYVFVLDGVASDGAREHFSATYKYDSLEYPLASLNQTQPLTISYSRIDDMSVEYKLRAQGQIVQSGVKLISEDAMTMTITVRTTNAQGETYTDVLVFRRA